MRLFDERRVFRKSKLHTQGRKQGTVSLQAVTWCHTERDGTTECLVVMKLIL